MNKEECRRIFQSIFNQYSKEMWIHSGGCEDRSYSYIVRREIEMPKSVFENPDEWDIITLLHEIGHIKTNNHKMKVYEKEYYATQWSANKAREIGFVVKKEFREVYQTYIWDKRQMCINKKGKNVPNKAELIIKW